MKYPFCRFIFSHMYSLCNVVVESFHKRFIHSEKKVLLMQLNAVQIPI